MFILLNAGLNAKEKDSFGQTPLHSACIQGDIQCAEMLIKHVNDIHMYKPTVVGGYEIITIKTLIVLYLSM